MPSELDAVVAIESVLGTGTGSVVDFSNFGITVVLEMLNAGGSQGECILTVAHGFDSAQKNGLIAAIQYTDGSRLENAAFQLWPNRDLALHPLTTDLPKDVSPIPVAKGNGKVTRGQQVYVLTRDAENAVQVAPQAVSGDIWSPYSPGGRDKFIAEVQKPLLNQAGQSGSLVVDTELEQAIGVFKSTIGFDPRLKEVENLLK
ncbi:hypothetical protein A2160_06145 [Candidatus Beckwithbacteria bacterium RBG_13_42_9]|uniref:Uncharacterized protein n=1 Tax=Candidatus Beckwithbacteria bacterium RBG_13_42_9 TaxID=1797457 RepID=A0A1F5E5A8_9BACT|nr:MAG: hypothetical protein A2160_06145 [Candidatus Beckwithbacteria bacterium RBG_13_42_9]